MIVIPGYRWLKDHAVATCLGLMAILVVSLSSAPSVSADAVAGIATVIDGDTIEIHGGRIRLHAIDAIEARQSCVLPDGAEWRCGRDVAFALADRILRLPVWCEIRNTDRYGRLVGVCYQSGEDLNAWMVENGWAVAYQRYGLDYVDEEKSARFNQRGIWKSRFMMPWDWRRK
ncbi:thermonuclease family protein [Defluviimonas sp. D31]|uniref:thermonuclease family protein n=1 Tax=Defluviimonas sp. D31 TaxID=3083253 RepID=UPI00296F95C9|nr:thermonuclease family protein [Defluviimonas sp. D31]MDW4548404.1 thermonuclease family protein [Defluviimonas sp. D31]